MTTEEAVALLERYSNYNGMGIQNLAGCMEAMKVAVDALKEAYPELAESEDERIREAIENIIRVYGKTQGEWIAGYDMDTLVVHLRNAFATLEKQKEQKPAEFTHHEVDESLVEAVDHQMEDDGVVDDFVRRGIDDIVLKYAELGAKWQREQKPAEIDEYKIIKKHITEDVLSSEVNKRLKECGWYVTDERPAEWNEEENEKQIRQIERIVKNAGCSAQLQERIHNWLKSLRSSWKPSRE